MSKTSLIIIGAGGFAREVAWLAEETHQYRVKGFLDDAEFGHPQFGYPILGSIDEWQRFEGSEFVVAIGAPRVRRAIVGRMEIGGQPLWATLVHPKVHLSRTVGISPGSIVTAGTVMTVDIQIGLHSQVNINSTIGHDCNIGDYVTIAPLVALSGAVVVDSGVEIGTGAAIRQGLHLSSGAFVGMGAVVTKDVASNTLAVGNPARPVRELPPF